MVFGFLRRMNPFKRRQILSKSEIAEKIVPGIDRQMGLFHLQEILRRQNDEHEFIVELSNFGKKSESEVDEIRPIMQRAVLDTRTIPTGVSRLLISKGFVTRQRLPEGHRLHPLSKLVATKEGVNFLKKIEEMEKQQH